MNFKTKFHLLLPPCILLFHTLLALGQASTKDELSAEFKFREIIEDYKSKMVIEGKNKYVDKPMPRLAPLHLPGLITNGSYKSPL